MLRGEAVERQDEGRRQEGRRAASTPAAARWCATPARSRRSPSTPAASTAPTAARRWRSSRRPSTSRAAPSPPTRPAARAWSSPIPSCSRSSAVRAFSLNNARYTRHHLASATGAAARRDPHPGAGLRGRRRQLQDPGREPDPARAGRRASTLEVWAYDRRSNQLEDLAGLDIAEEFASPEIALDWLFGGELGLTLHPAARRGAEPPRACSTTRRPTCRSSPTGPNLVFSRDIDAVVDGRDARPRTNQNVFLGGHSAGTGFTARYAATDFNLTGVGPADPGYAKLRGLVLLEGGGGSTARRAAHRPTRSTASRPSSTAASSAPCATTPPAASTASRRARSRPRRPTASASCRRSARCRRPSYSVVAGLLNPRILAAGEVAAIQAILDPDSTREHPARRSGRARQQRHRQGAGPLRRSASCRTSTAFGGLGSFIDDDGLVAGIASFVATSVGAPGPTVGGVQTWLDITEGPLRRRCCPTTDRRRPTLPGGVLGPGEGGHAARPVGRRPSTSAAPTSPNCTTRAPGSSVTSVDGRLHLRHLQRSATSALACTHGGQCSQSINLDSTALSVGRGRRDIENLTQAAAIDIPVIAFGGSNGLATVPGVFTRFGNSIGACTAPSCDGTPRVVDASDPESRLPDLRRRRRRLRGGDRRGLRPPRRGHRGGRRR